MVHKGGRVLNTSMCTHMKVVTHTDTWGQNPTSALSVNIRYVYKYRKLAMKGECGPERPQDSAEQFPFFLWAHRHVLGSEKKYNSSNVRMSLQQFSRTRSSAENYYRVSSCNSTAWKHSAKTRDAKKLNRIQNALTVFWKAVILLQSCENIHG